MSKISKRFQGKVAIVTASTQGIGFAIAERLGREGASVVISSRKQVLFFLYFLLFKLGNSLLNLANLMYIIADQ